MEQNTAGNLQQPLTQSVCPHCGYCPHCGRGGYHTYPQYPYQPWITWTVSPVTVTYGTGYLQQNS